MSSYIDFDQLDEHVGELNEFIQEELEIQTYRETMLLLERARRTLKPKKKSSKTENLDYLG